jgi:hypothetical protein
MLKCLTQIDSDTIKLCWKQACSATNSWKWTENVNRMLTETIRLYSYKPQLWWLLHFKNAGGKRTVLYNNRTVLISLKTYGWAVALACVMYNILKEWTVERQRCIVRSLIKLIATGTSRLPAWTAWLTAKRYKVFPIRVKYRSIKIIKWTCIFCRSPCRKPDSDSCTLSVKAL